MYVFFVHVFVCVVCVLCVCICSCVPMYTDVFVLCLLCARARTVDQDPWVPLSCHSLFSCIFTMAVFYIGLIYIDSYYDDDEAKFRVSRWKGKEVTYIDNVKFCGGLSQEPTKACIVFRIPVRHFVIDY